MEDDTNLRKNILLVCSVLIIQYVYHFMNKYVVSSLFSKAYSIITKKDYLRKENARIKQKLKKNDSIIQKIGYQESIISKIFRRITNKHSLPQSQQLTQATDIQEEEIIMSINLPYVEGTSEKLRRILRSHKASSTFYTEKTLRKLLCKTKDRVVTEDKNNIVCEIDCNSFLTKFPTYFLKYGFLIDGSY